MVSRLKTAKRRLAALESTRRLQQRDSWMQVRMDLALWESVAMPAQQALLIETVDDHMQGATDRVTVQRLMELCGRT